jgi:hypothetical protein
MRRFFPFLLGMLLILCAPYSAQAQEDDYVRAPRLGITFISSVDHPADELRYRRALLLGAGWNRWPLYWDRVELQSGQFNWESYDRLVADDLRHGLHINAILLGRPAFYQDGNSIVGIDRPIFADGTDAPGEGKGINPSNPWANFVYQSVMRYKPGGTLAGALGWGPEDGIRVWEVWNEPDYALFWNGTADQYARLLKVAYIVTHAAYPDARVMFGGLAMNGNLSQSWLSQVLDIYSGDPNREQYNWYMDQVAVHSYTYARRSALVVRQAKSDLARYKLNKPIWLNESGVPVWDDYPGPTWAGADPSARVYRATMQQQAAYVVESTAYAWAEGAEVVFFHQLYDDCGNQPSGTDFPPNDGKLCVGGHPCWGDAHGLYRNERGEACFRQHPAPGSPRPSAAAFHMLAQIFGTVSFGNASVKDPYNSGVLIRFDILNSNKHIYVLWNRTLAKADLSIPAGAQEGDLYTINNQDSVVNPTGGKYTISLLPATRDDYPFLRPGDAAAIGGSPVILVENTIGSLLASAGDRVEESTEQPVAQATAAPRPTVDPALDKNPPVTAMQTLPPESLPTFNVSWSAQDDSGIEKYLVWVRVNNGDWKPWLETQDTGAQYTGVSGSTYDFAVWAVDLAGNWSPNTDITPQASTTVK